MEIATIPPSVWTQYPIVLIVLVAIFFLLRSFEKFIEKRDLQWQGFLGEQRKADQSALTQLMQEVKRLAQELVNLRGDFDRHDACEMEILRKLDPPDAETDPKTRTKRLPKSGGA